jgi:hypothetical protein
MDGAELKSRSPAFFSRPLRSPIERGRDGEGSAYGQHNEAQQTAQPSENEAEL